MEGIGYFIFGVIALSVGLTFALAWWRRINFWLAVVAGPAILLVLSMIMAVATGSANLDGDFLFMGYLFLLSLIPALIVAAIVRLIRRAWGERREG